MHDALRQTRSYLMRLFQSEGINPRSDLGQNFLIDLNIIDFIVRSAELTLDDVVLEVGPGTGGMTTFLGQDAAHVVSVELDANMHRLASQATADCPNVTLLNCDALRDKNHLADELLTEVRRQLGVDDERRLKLVANLPYAVATPVVSNLVATDLPWTRMVITIQYELGLRMRARPGSSHYGALAVWLQSQARVRMLKKLGPKVFWPRPGVDSAVVQIDPAPERRARIADRGFFHEFIRRLFQQRRKRLRAVLGQMYKEPLGKPVVNRLLAELDLPDTSRAEDMDVPTLIRVANRFYSELNPESSR
ncbi:MAG: ribosomal RNA small subunit methyltransferase A [Planctomycetaceae bacterium]|nr:ribosomal RNA small subunit methyltransferase A [Planctomycetaceae bacterium]